MLIAALFIRAAAKRCGRRRRATAHPRSAELLGFVVFVRQRPSAPDRLRALYVAAVSPARDLHTSSRALSSTRSSRNTRSRSDSHSHAHCRQAASVLSPHDFYTSAVSGTGFGRKPIHARLSVRDWVASIVACAMLFESGARQRGVAMGSGLRALDDAPDSSAGHASRALFSVSQRRANAVSMRNERSRRPRNALMRSNFLDVVPGISLRLGPAWYGESHYVEIHHLRAFPRQGLRSVVALGGEHGLQSLALRYRAHNALDAEQDSSRQHVEHRRQRGRR
jgi:hypothetical protein